MNLQEENFIKRRASELWNKNVIDDFEMGKTVGIQSIHRYIFNGIVSKPGTIRQVDIQEENFIYSPALFIVTNLNAIDDMPFENFDQIVAKFVEMSTAHPFMRGNDFVTRMWLDQMLIDKLSKCVDWSKIDKYDYLRKLEEASFDDSQMNELLKSALIDVTNNRQLHIGGLDILY
ncbi:MAG: cell filamentation protein Fic [Clostridiales bacterium]|nr:MAG: cell filamentation protein Fic [Clostridiales bacterium]